MCTVQLRQFLLFWLVTVDSMRYSCDRELTSCGCGYKDVESYSRIINGEEARPYSWSMIVSLRMGHWNHHQCGGSILSESFILTAAHCVDRIAMNPSQMSVRAGIHYLSENSAIIRQVDRIYVHPNWAGTILDAVNDIALLHLSEPLDFARNPFIHRTCLPQIELDEDVTYYPPNDTLLSLAGWGRINFDVDDPPQVLQQATLRAIHHTFPKCASFIQNPLLQFCGGLYEGGKSKSDNILSVH